MASISYDPLRAAGTHDQLKQGAHHRVQAIPTDFQDCCFLMKLFPGKHKRLVTYLEIGQALVPDKGCCYWDRNYFGTQGPFPCFLASTLCAALHDEMGWHHNHQ
jgi:hypothetical protein